jgi:hypothetical protein
MNSIHEAASRPAVSGEAYRTKNSPLLSDSCRFTVRERMKVAAFSQGEIFQPGGRRADN